MALRLNLLNYKMGHWHCEMKRDEILNLIAQCLPCPYRFGCWMKLRSLLPKGIRWGKAQILIVLRWQCTPTPNLWK